MAERIPWSERYPAATVLHMEGSLEAALAMIAAAGFEAVELWGSEAHLDPRLDPDVQAVKRLLRHLGLRAHSIHTPYDHLKLGHLDPGLKVEWQRVVGKALEMGAELGARIAVVHVTSDVKHLPDEAYDESRALAIEFVEALNRRAKALGIRLAVENLPLLGRHRFGSSLQELAEAFPDPEIGFCLDVGHVWVNRMSLHAEVQAAGSRLISVHAHNNDGQHDRHWPPPEGVADWGQVRRELAAIGYEGPYVLEVVCSREIEREADPGGLLRQLAAFAEEDARV